jgi:excinuclease UvrABC nuclease subunit
LKNNGAHRALSDAEVTGKALIKMIKEAKKSFNLSTIEELIALQSGFRQPYKPLTTKKKLQEDVYGLPNAPGIYYFLNSKNEIIYIGKAKSLRDRVKSYFSPTAPRKAKRIVKQASRLKIEITNSELTALLTEAESIKLVNPRHNLQLKRYGSKYFLRITASQKFPALEICNYFDFDGNDYFGLFISRKKAQEVFEVLTKTFTIRECDDKELAKEKACFLAQIDRCVAPCETKDMTEYKEELEKVYEFLYGKSQNALNRLLNKMKEYSEKLKYEKAGEVKVLVDMILSQVHKSSLLAEPVNSANVLFEINEGFGTDYILMITGKIFIKKYSLKKRDYFEETLDDYYEGTINLNSMPEDEDLEKMKITLNWLIKNRNKVRTFYLKDYKSKSELYTQLTNNNFNNSIPEETSFDIKHFLPVEA